VLIELIPPALADLDAVVGIKVEKQRAEPLLLGPLLLLILQPITDPLCPGVVVTAVADENGAHEANAEAALAKLMELRWPGMCRAVALLLICPTLYGADPRVRDSSGLRGPHKNP
jgi:hypothetical protein